MALYIKGQLESTELHLGVEEEVRIKGKAREGDIIVRVCYRPPD